MRDTQAEVALDEVRSDCVQPELGADAAVKLCEGFVGVDLAVGAAVVEEQDSADRTQEDGQGAQAAVSVDYGQAVLDVEQVVRGADELAGRISAQDEGALADHAVVTVVQGLIDEAARGV